MDRGHAAGLARRLSKIVAVMICAMAAIYALTWLPIVAGFIAYYFR